MHKTTWYEFADSFCARKTSLITGGSNSYFEPLAARRYNYATKGRQLKIRQTKPYTAGGDLSGARSSATRDLPPREPAKYLLQLAQEVKDFKSPNKTLW